MQTQNRGNGQGTPNTPLAEEGRGGGRGRAVVEARELPAQCPHSHSHTNRTLDSLNNVDRPPFYGHVSKFPRSKQARTTH